MPGWTDTPTNVTSGGAGVVSLGLQNQVLVFSARGKAGEVEMSSLNTTTGVFLPGSAI